MPQPRVTSQWPNAGERRTKCTLQYAVPTSDGGGGWLEPTWTNFRGTWSAKVSDVPGGGGESKDKTSYQIEGLFREDLFNYFHGIERPPDVPVGQNVSIRLIANGLTLQVFDVENPQLVNRTLIAHCAKTLRTQ